MRPRVLTALALSAAFAAAVGHAQTSPPASDPPRPAPATPAPSPAPQHFDYAQIPQTVTFPAARPAPLPQVAVGDLPLDTLVAELKAIQAKKAALAEREGEVAKEVRKRLAEYTDTLNKLDPAPAPRVVPAIDPAAVVIPPTPQPRRKTGTLPAPEIVPDLPPAPKE